MADRQASHGTPEARCELSDLPESMCSHCRGHADPVEVEVLDVGPLFAARFDGHCESCAGPIRAGDIIAALADGDGYACTGCLP